MLIIPVDEPVFLLRFLPDGRRLFVGTGTGGRTNVARFTVWPIGGGEPVQLDLGELTHDAWHFSGKGNPVAFHPTRPIGYLAWAGKLRTFHPDTGKPALAMEGTAIYQVCLSADGERGLAARTYHTQRRQLYGFVVGGRREPTVFPTAEARLALGGFLPDGDRVVTLEDAIVRVRSFATGEYLAAGRHKLGGLYQCTISPCGRWLVALGYGSLYLCDLAALDTKPRQIKSSSNFGDFRSVAFHPDGRRMAVIHGGPTLVKVYDTASLKQKAVFKWKLGPMTAVAFSPDGTLAAAGSDDGRVVVWDVED